MKRTRVFGRLAAILACLGMMAPAQLGQTAEPAQQVAAATKVIDVALLPGGELRGQATNAQGVALAGRPVSIWKGRRQVAATTTDESGGFRVSGLRGGSYRIVAGGGSRMFRLWVANTAPAAARDSALVVVDEEQVLGQGRMKYWLSNPWVIAGIVAVAVAVPVAIHNHNKDRGPSSP